MNSIRSLYLLFVVAAVAVTAPVANAGSRCTDDPERCVERGASVSRPAARTVAATPAAAMSQTMSPTVISLPARKATLSKKAPKVARVAPPASPTPAPTPGMGMLLKLSSGTGGDVTWAPGGRTVDNTTGASWIL